ncbi:hypothetical protein [Denitromonas iodatirespirans]|uniref:Uncharacterized protein n=1 Tax=Denitromonas iodatirespirans TaxID=2795389 RepID=A0A944HE85_DENI1|nr:hypothetical protein [Denitromonas iodatirespirans]MBT0962681.1 hypothetical protein [Denitromonas iodatirespirans]
MSARRGPMLAALLLAASTAPALGAEAPLGRLFFTPEERAALDRNESPTEARTLPRVDGIVQRKGAPATVWIDGQPRRDVPAGTRRARVVGPDGQPVWRTVGEPADATDGPTLHIQRHDR